MFIYSPEYLNENQSIVKLKNIITKVK